MRPSVSFLFFVDRWSILDCVEETKFSQRIKELRIEYNLTQEALAKKFNVHRTTVMSWEVKKKEPNYLTLMKLAEFFDVSADYLLGLED